VVDQLLILVLLLNMVTVGGQDFNWMERNLMDRSVQHELRRKKIYMGPGNATRG